MDNLDMPSFRTRLGGMSIDSLVPGHALLRAVSVLPTL
jgi:hypothetical protein